MVAAGYWAVMIWDNEMFKYGKNSDVEFPYPTFAEAVKQVRGLQEAQKEGDDFNYYILEVFSNGQMRTFFCRAK